MTKIPKIEVQREIGTGLSIVQFFLLLTSWLIEQLIVRFCDLRCGFLVQTSPNVIAMFIIQKYNMK